MSDSGKTLPGAFELFKPSKEAALKNKESFLIIVLLPSLLLYLAEVMTKGLDGANSLTATTVSASSTAGMLSLAGLLLFILFLPAYYLLLVRAAKGKVTQPLALIREGFKIFWRVFGLTIFLTLLIGVGLLLLIVPGLILITRYFLTPYFLVAENLTIREAMRRSAAASKGNAGAIWGVIGVIVLLSLLSIIPIVGGIISLIAVTLYATAPAFRYLQLK